MARILGIDVGERRIGVALSDESGILATGIEVIDRKRTDPVARVKALAEQHGVVTTIVGLPLDMDGGEGRSAKLARDLGGALERKAGLSVVYVDERLTTVAAESALIEGGVRRQDRKGIIDRIAAQLILQSYLDATPRP
ncbi:MAG: Holliday junction resolvase RuvX [Acidobacteriota bacterium]